MSDHNSHSNATSYVNGLKQTIKDKEADFLFTRNELENTLLPSIKATDYTYIVSELIMSNLEYTKRNGLTPKAKETRDKLLILMNIGELFNQLSIENQNLKIINRNAFNKIQSLRNENKELNRQHILAGTI